MKKPNIIFIFSDQQRWDTLGCYGQKLNVSPYLDRMAKEGILFENHFSCQPVSSLLKEKMAEADENVPEIIQWVQY